MNRVSCPLKMYDISPADFAHHVHHAKNWKDLAVRCGCEVDRYGKIKHRRMILYMQKKASNLNLNVDHFNEKKKDVDDDVFMKIVHESHSLYQVKKKIESVSGIKKHTTTHNRRIQELGIDTSHWKKTSPQKTSTARLNRLYNNKIIAMDDETFKTIVKNSKSWSELCLKCGYTNTAGKKTIVARKIEMLGLNTNHFYHKNHTFDKDKVFCLDSRYTATDELKKSLVKDLGWRYECNECKNIHFVEQDGVLTWMNKPVILQLDHINGIRNDNRVENLRFLCALCHAQTSTFCGKNNKKYKALQAWLEDGMNATLG